MTVRDDVLTFLRDPQAFAAGAADPETWLAGLDDFALPSIAARSDRGLRPAQEAAWRGLANRRAGLVLGPPGTGKTHLLSWLIAGYGVARARSSAPARVFVTAFTKNAAANVLEAVAKRHARHAPNAPAPIYYGAPPDAGLAPGVRHFDRGDEDALIAELTFGRAVVGGTIWSLYRLLTTGRVPTGDGVTAPLFDLVCIDEASQMVLGHGLLALAGLAPEGRVVVAGDDQQLPPVRAARSAPVAGRELGGSLYAFLKSANAAEFALEETFRLNAPLASFPERRFYPGRYVSAEPDERLCLRPDWAEGLDLFTRAALDPAFPVTVIVHDGPSASTANALEANLAARVATALFERLMDDSGAPVPAAAFWSERAAIVSPHRAQNAAIRNALPETIRTDAFVETVDRIQGKERDVVILSYCVSDPEFALAEAEFIFSPERLNVAITRARTKLVVLVSRNLLDAAPTEQDVMDKAEVLKEFVFSCAEQADLQTDGPLGRPVRIQIRTRGFDGDDAVLDLTPDERPETPSPEMTPALEAVLEAVRQEVVEGDFEAASLSRVKRRLARSTEPFSEARALHDLGWLSLRQRTGQYGPYWTARPFDVPRRIYEPELDTVRTRIGVLVREAKRGRYAFYDDVRDRFTWMNPEGGDRFLPVLQHLASEGVLILGSTANGAMTVELVVRAAETVEAPFDDQPVLFDADFTLLNLLEDIEAARINFGVFDAWTSAVELGRRAGARDITDSLSRLDRAGHMMLAEDGRVRSRMAELARELRYVKQRFRSDDADRRPYLVRSLKVELRERRKPKRGQRLRTVFEEVASALPATEARALLGLATALESLWGEAAALAGFQARGLQAGLAAWRGQDCPTIAIAADTGSGKTEAAVLPMIAGLLADAMAGVRGVRAVLAYPRIRLAANQAQRLAAYLSACQDVPDLPLVTLGLQVGDVPDRFERMGARYRETWQPSGPDGFTFPFFACPNCSSPLRLQAGGGREGADALICARGDWRYDGWIGSKAGLQAHPPSLFLPTTDSLHQWMHDPRYGRLFGDDPDFAAPRALLADEIHLYTHIHGAQVGLTLQRLVARAGLNSASERPMMAVGMSATIGEPGQAWGRLIGRADVTIIKPEEGEADLNPRGREYFYFVQPEVESRGSDIAGASTTIQSLMCIAHGVRRRTGSEGGYRSLVFFDSIDRMRRLHGAYVDAEEGKELAAFRTSAYGDDALGQPQTACCGDPVGCDRYFDGECWWFAATDSRQWGAAGLRRPGDPLRVARTPIYSGTSSEAEALVKGADVVFATSSLEVGYDDPDIALVYQHYAPQNLASFVQRKGRGGRAADDRPVTAVTLSIYSPRDNWWFRRPSEMVSPTGFESPINPGNAFVRRGQALSALLDGLARWGRRRGELLAPASIPPAAAFTEAGRLVEAAFSKEIWSEFGVADAAAFWRAAQAARAGLEIRYFVDLRLDLAWAPNLLFDTVNLPAVSIRGEDVFGGDREDVSFALSTVAPGNATRRYSPSAVHWRAPEHGRAPWFAPEDYATAERSALRLSTEALLEELPLEARDLLKDAHPEFCRPTRITLDRLGRMAGAYWTAEWGFDAQRHPTIAPLADGDPPIGHDSRSELRGFLLVEADPASARGLELGSLSGLLSEVHAHAGEGLNDAPAGLTATPVYWGADAEVRPDLPGAAPLALSQTFVDPQSGRPLLHGYAVRTEGLRFCLNAERLDAFVTAQLADLANNDGERRWRELQLARYLIESRARASGASSYEAKRGSDLIAAIQGDPALRARLNRLLRFWSPDDLAALFEEVRATRLGQHPLMTRARVGKAAEALSAPAFQAVIRESLATARDPEAMGGYVRTLSLHSLTLKLRRLVAHVGQADDSRLLAHVRLPLQFGGASDDVITVCEAGAGGDGTTRTVIDAWDRLGTLCSEGFLSACPNAAEDAALGQFWRLRERHDDWRALDPRSANALGEIGEALACEGPPPSSVSRILFGVEAIEGEAIALYDIAAELEAVKATEAGRVVRPVLDWEIASAAVEAAKHGTAPQLARLYDLYAHLSDAGDGSLSADARLAEQAFRLAAPLCIDGCRACVHQASDIVGNSLVETTVSRRILTCLGV